MDIINDGSVVAGSRDVTINGVLYTMTNWRWNETNTVIERHDKNNKVSGRKVIKQGTTGSATAQLATTTTVVPPARVPFTVAEPNQGNITVYLTEVGREESNGAETTVPVTFAHAATGTITQSN